VGWGFKEARFRQHAAALELPKIEYIGCGVPVDETAALVGEKKTLQDYAVDPLGNSGRPLAKRRARNPFSRKTPYNNPVCAKLVW
jgi:hypothetical protein